MRRVLAGLSCLLSILALMLVWHPATNAAPVLAESTRTVISPPQVKLAQQYYYTPYFSPFQPPQPQVRRLRRAPEPQPQPQAQPRAAALCETPMVYSHGLKRCICVAEGHGLVEGKCVQLAEACEDTKRWSSTDQKCVCRAGHVPQGDQCIHPQLHAGVSPNPGEEPLLTSDIALIQKCMIESGYLKGSVSGTMTPAAWTAFWFFKKDHNVGPTPKGVLDLKSQLRLFDLCPQAQAALGTDVASVGAPQTAPSAAAKNPDEADAPVVSGTARPRVFAAAEAQCLPADLLERVIGAYGPRPALGRCLDSCLPVPSELGPKEIASYEANRVVEWCKSCLQINSHLPLDDILLIERETNVSLCSRPPTQLPRWSLPGQSGRAAFTRVREIYRPFPPGAGHEKDFAVIIGNRTYRGEAGFNGSAHNNAGAVYALLTEHQGFAADHVIDLRDATLDDMKRVFGSQGKTGELAAKLKDGGDARLIVYYAGHGVTRSDQSESYLLPVDALPHRAAQTAYPLSALFEQIAALGLKSAVVFLEAEFGRDISDIIYPPNLPAMRAKTLPGAETAGLIVMAAATGDQRTLEDPRYGIGLFTRYVIEGLAGRADLAPIGNGDSAVDAVELYAYTAHMVRLAARKSFGLLQQPLATQGGNPRISQKQAHGN